MFSSYPFVTNSHGNQAGIGIKYEICSCTAGDTGGKQNTRPGVVGISNELLIIQTTGKKQEKRISRSSLEDALKTVLNLQKQGKEITDPEQLNVERAGYVFSMFKRFGLKGCEPSLGNDEN